MTLPKRKRSIWIPAAKISVSLLLLSLFVFKSNITSIISTVRMVPFVTIVKSGAVIAVINLLWALKWNVLIPQVPFKRVLSLTVIAQYYSFILFGQLSGEVVKVYRLVTSGEDAELLAASVVIDKFTSLIALMVLALTGLVLSETTLIGIWIMVVGCFLIVFAIMLSGMFESTSKIALHSISLLPLPARWRAKMHQFGKQYFFAWSKYLRQPLHLCVNVLLSLIAHFLSVFIIAFPASDFGITIAFTDWFWIYGVMSVAVLLPVSMGGIGIRDGSLIGLLAYMGVSADRALALSLMLFFFFTGGAVVGGLLDMVYLFQRRRDGSTSKRHLLQS